MYREIKPTNALSIVGRTPLRFTLPALPEGTHYKISDLILVLDLKLTKEDGVTPLPQNTRIGLQNNVLHSCFRYLFSALYVIKLVYCT